MDGWMDDICWAVVRTYSLSGGSGQASMRRQWKRDLKEGSASCEPLGQTLQRERTRLVQWP